MNRRGAGSSSDDWRKRASDAVGKAVTYLRDRQSSNGGFCFYRGCGVDEPNLSDTWHAVAALTLVGTRVPRAGETAASLDDYSAAPLEALYQQVFTLDRLNSAAGIGERHLRRIRDLEPMTVLSTNTPSTACLENLLRAVCLRPRFATAETCDEVVDYLLAQRRDGGWGDKPNLADTSLALATLKVLGAAVAPTETRDFVDSLQVASLGFTATQDSLFASLDTVHAGVCACALLGLPVRHSDDVIDYALACQSSNGGFARTPDALPDIALTHHALQTLGVLQVVDTAPVLLPPVGIGI